MALQMALRVFSAPDHSATYFGVPVAQWLPRHDSGEPNDNPALGELWHILTFYNLVRYLTSQGVEFKIVL